MSNPNIKFQVRGGITASMVTTNISGGRFTIWADAPDKQSLYKLIEAILDENTEEMTIFRTELDEASNNDFRLEIYFDMVAEGLFVGDLIAELLEEELDAFEGSQMVYYKQLDAEEVEEYR